MRDDVPEDFEPELLEWVLVINLKDDVGHQLEFRPLIFAWLDDWHQRVTVKELRILGQQLSMDIHFIQAVLLLHNLIDLRGLLASVPILMVLNNDIIKDLGLLLVHVSMILPIAR